MSFRLSLTVVVVAARVGVAPGDVALDGARPIFRDAVLRANVDRANRFAALTFRALVVLALHILGVIDQCVSVGALHGVTEALRF